MTVNQTSYQETEDTTGVRRAGRGKTGRKGQDAGSGHQKDKTRKRTTRGKKTTINRKQKSPVKNPEKRRNAGHHTRPFVLEVVDTLIAEDYAVSKVLNPDSPFDLIATKGDENIRIHVARPGRNITNARSVVEQYREAIDRIRPFWKSDRDNLQIRIPSRTLGQVSYQVYAGGIWNVRTKQRAVTKTPPVRPDATTGEFNAAIKQMRDACDPSEQTGAETGPVQVTAQAGIPMKSPC